MTYLFAFLGFAALIVLHEFGHFAAAKAVGMRVERFALFFPPLIFKRKYGETEYGVGAVPLGGYVKITGMSRNEPIDPEHEPRAYYRQAAWKRAFVIAAGPFVNIVVAFLILFVLFWARGTEESTRVVEKVETKQAAAGVVKPGDKLLAVNGVKAEELTLYDQLQKYDCIKAPTNGCVAGKAITLLVLRDGKQTTLKLKPRYDGQAKRFRVGVRFVYKSVPAGPLQAANLSIKGMWNVTTTSVSTVVQLFKAEKREQLSGVVGAYEVTRQSFGFDVVQAFQILALFSLSLAIINLFPFLPLDGGHLFWILIEKLRGKPVSHRLMERAGLVGFMLVIMLGMIGLSNDIGRITGEGFGVR